MTEVDLSLFMDDMIIYLEKKMESTKQLLRFMGCLIQGEYTETTIILYRQSKMEINNSPG